MGQARIVVGTGGAVQGLSATLSPRWAVAEAGTPIAVEALPAIVRKAVADPDAVVAPPHLGLFDPAIWRLGNGPVVRAWRVRAYSAAWTPDVYVRASDGLVLGVEPGVASQFDRHKSIEVFRQGFRPRGTIDPDTGQGEARCYALNVPVPPSPGDPWTPVPADGVLRCEDLRFSTFAHASGDRECECSGSTTMMETTPCDQVQPQSCPEWTPPDEATTYCSTATSSAGTDAFCASPSSPSTADAERLRDALSDAYDFTMQWLRRDAVDDGAGPGGIDVTGTHRLRAVTELCCCSTTAMPQVGASSPMATVSSPATFDYDLEVMPGKHLTGSFVLPSASCNLGVCDALPCTPAEALACLEKQDEDLDGIFAFSLEADVLKVVVDGTLNVTVDNGIGSLGHSSFLGTSGTFTTPPYGEVGSSSLSDTGSEFGKSDPSFIYKLQLGAMSKLTLHQGDYTIPGIPPVHIR